MDRLGGKQKKKSTRTTELNQLKEELRQVSERLESCEQELTQVLEQQTATSEILGVIASSPTDIQPTLDVMRKTRHASVVRAMPSSLLGVIANSPTDIQPVLDIVAENAARLCDASDALIFRIDGDRQAWMDS